MRQIFLLLLLIITFGSLSAQNDSTIVRKTSLFNNKPVIHFKFKVNSRTEINILTRIISIDNVDSNDVFAYANENEFNKFLAYNYSYELINDALIVPENQTTTQPANTSFQAINYYPTYTVYDSIMTAFSTNYPNICRLINIKTLNSGRKLLFAKISKNPDIKENEPTFLYTSSMHGDEITGYILMLDLISYLLTNYGVDPRITRMIDSTEIWINPLANPDGTYHGGNSAYIVTNAVRYNANNVDLNRNYPNRYSGPHPDGNAWQPETIAFMGLADTVNFTMSTNFHGGSQVCNYPWDDTLALTADDSWWQYVCREWVDTIHLYNATYMKSLNNGITDGAAWYMVTGGRQDYMNFYHHCREFTCEMSNNKTPVEGSLTNYWNYNWHSFLNYIEQSQYGVRGNITDSITGNPIKAKVYISGFDKDSSEVYSFLPHGNYYRHLIAGNYNITYSAPCYLPKTISITAINRSAATQNVQLVPITVNAGNDVSRLCGDSVILTPTTNYPNNAANLTWSWSPATGLNSTTIKNPVAKPNTTTNYIVNLTSVEGCFATDTIQVTVNPMTVNAGADVTRLCGDSVILNPITNYPSNEANLTYSWNPINGLNSISVKNPVAKPNTTTNYIVNFTSVEGCFATDTIQVTVNPITVNAGADVTRLCGDSVILNPITNYPSNEANLTYSWNPFNGLNSTSIKNPVAKPNTTTNYVVSLTSIEGCFATDTILVSVNPMSVNAGSDVTYICGDSVIFNPITNYPSNEASLTYSWIPTNGLNSTSIKNPFAKPNTTTNYVVSLTSVEGCFATDTIQITVNPMTVNAGNDVSKICGDSVIFNPITNYPSNEANLTYSWNPINGLNSISVKNPVAKPNTTTNYVVSLTSVEGCYATDTIQITVNPMIVNAGNDVSKICGDSVIFNPITNYPSNEASLTYSWIPANGLNSTTIKNPIVKPITTTNYIVNLTSIEGCFATDTIQVTVNSMTVNAGNDLSNICGDSVVLNPITNYLSNEVNLTFSWSPANGLNNTNVKSPVAKPNTTTNYVVSLTSIEGCFASDTIQVTVNPMSVNAGSDFAYICGDSVIFNPITNYPSNEASLTYSWIPTNGLNSTSIKNPVAKPNTTTNYVVSLTSIEGCFASDTIQVSVNPITFNAGIDVTYICGDSVIFNPITNYPSNEANLTYSWSPTNGLNNTTFKNPVAKPNTSTNYIVSLTSVEGCFAKDTILVTVNPMTVNVGNDVSYICGDSVILNPITNYSNIETNLTWSWIPTNGLNSTSIKNPVAKPNITTIYILSLTSVEGCFATDTIQVTVNPMTLIAGSDVAYICGDSIILNPITNYPSNVSNLAYSWSPTNGLNNTTFKNPVAKPNTTTNYVVSLTSVEGCFATDTIQVTVNSMTVNAGNDLSNICGDSVVLNPITNYLSNEVNLTFSWSPANGLNNTNVKSPVAKPNTTTNYVVSLTSIEGCFASDTIQVTVNPMSVNAGSDFAYICGDSVIFNPITNYPSNEASLTYSWIPANGLNSTTIKNPIAKPNTTTNYIVNLTSVEGCFATDTIQVTVNPMTLIAGSDVAYICGDSVIFNPITNYPSNEANLTYSWNPTNGLNNTTFKNPVAKPNTTTNYVVSLTSVEGCFATDTIQVTVNPMTLIAGSDVAYICGDSIALTPNTNYPSNEANLTYSWSPVIGLNSTTIKDPIAKPNITTYYIVSLTSVEGCFATDTIQVTVNTMTVNAGSDVTYICGDSVIFNPITNYPSNEANLTYSWSPTNGLNNTNIKNPVAKPIITTNYIVSLTSVEGCFATDTILVNVNPMTVNAGNDIVLACGDNVNLSPNNNYPGSQSNLNYLWSPAIGLDSVNIANPKAHPLSTITYYLNLSSIEGCNTIDSIKINIIPLSVTTNNITKTCGDSITFGTTINSNSTSIIYSWTPVNGLSNPAILNPLVNPTHTTTYILNAIDQSCTVSDTVIVTVNTANFNLNFTANDTLFTSPPFIVQFNNNTPDITNYNFTWNFGDDTILNSNNAIVNHTYYSNGMYSVSLIATDIVNSCSDTIIKTSYISCNGLGINQQSTNSFKFNVFPNPNKGEFNLLLTGTKADHYNINLSSIIGENIYNESVQSIDNNFQKNIHLTNIPKGLYFVTISSEQGKIIKKIVIQ